MISKTILMISPQPFFSNRGSPLNAYNKIKILSELGHNVTVFTYPEGMNVPGFTIIRISSLPFLKNIPIGPSIHKIIYDILLLLKGISIIRKQRFDVIHAHEIDGAIIGVILKKICKKAHRPVLYYDMHSLLSEQMRNNKYNISFLLDHILKYIEIFAYRNSDRLLMISPSFVNRLSEFNQQEKALFIPDIPALNEEYVDPKMHEELKNKIKHKVVFFYMGNIQNYQGVYLLLKAFRIIERSSYDTGLVIVGGTKEELKNLEEIVKKLGLKRVYLFCQQPLEKMPTFLSLADIVVSPRLMGTNIPFKIYPYLKTGKPIIATDILAHSNLLENNKNALLCAVDHVDMGKKMLLLLQDESLRQSIGMGARDLFEKKFSPEKFKAKLEKLYG